MIAVPQYYLDRNGMLDDRGPSVLSSTICLMIAVPQYYLDDRGPSVLSYLFLCIMPLHVPVCDVVCTLAYARGDTLRMQVRPAASRMWRHHLCSSRARAERRDSTTYRMFVQVDLKDALHH
jgi:hypothetical protein